MLHTAESNSSHQSELREIFLAGLRKRFKSEVNRMTGGDMLALLKNQKDADALSFLMTYVYIYNWLQHNVDADYQADVLAAFSKGPQAFLMAMLLNSNSTEHFVTNYINHWLEYSGEPQQQQQDCLQLLKDKANDTQQLIKYLLDVWQSLNLFTQTYAVAYRDLAKQEKDRYREMLGPEDKERLALIDALPHAENYPTSYTKLGLIPHMGCPQTCRHCMFIFRPLLKDKQDPASLFQQIDGLTNSVLFTGGDLTNHLEHFYNAILSMRNVTTFAILLNGDFAESRDIADQVIGKMASSIRRRPVTWPKAKVILQISFDEFHQEVYIDKKGDLKERIPVSKIASIVETAPKYANELQLCLIHKQTNLNFSMDLFKKGVFARLARELGSRGHQVQIMHASPSARLKLNPQNPDQPAQVIKDASFVLSSHPNTPMMLTSSTLDAYGRAAEMDANEAVNERGLLQEILTTGNTHGEYFDTDLMFWFNGWATLFSAVHICLGNVFEEGMETVLKRLAKDPLSKAIYHFDRCLLDYYAEICPDLEKKLETTTGPHHLFHTITEDANVRLHMTKRLIEDGHLMQ